MIYYLARSKGKERSIHEKETNGLFDLFKNSGKEKERSSSQGVIKRLLHDANY